VKTVTRPILFGRYNADPFARCQVWPTSVRWYVVLILVIVRLLGRLPLRVLHALGAALGWIYWIHRGRTRLDAERTLALAMPQLSDEQRDRLLRRTLDEIGKSILEICRVWSGTATRALSLVREVRGVEIFDQALAAGRGVIVAAPHLGCWELLNFYLCSRTPLAIVYRPLRQPELEPIVLKARAALDAELVRAGGPALRGLYKRLNSGGAVGILPDQQPREGDGEFAPFFGVPALTMILLSRLAQRTGATVVFSFAERLDDSRGFRVHFLAAPEGIADPDLSVAVAALNRGVENCVRLAPHQYQWHYKRYSIRPPGDERKIY
jgi:Kdo2-lipid IVA lauroyltransferase/acyltransferase